jgi:hypothetical protein
MTQTLISWFMRCDSFRPIQCFIDKEFTIPKSPETDSDCKYAPRSSIGKVNRNSKDTKGNIMVRPAQYELVIGVTSLWLLIPVLNGFASLFTKPEKQHAWAVFTLILMTLFSACISTAMWKNCLGETILYRMDLLCAKMEFTALVLYFALFRDLAVWVQCFFPMGVAVMYLVTERFHSKQQWFFNTWAHLIFRYIGYWWCHVALIHEQHLWRSFLFLSFGYFSHIIIKMRHVFRDKTFDINKEYCSSLAEMVVVIGGFGIVHYVLFVV